MRFGKSSQDGRLNAILLVALVINIAACNDGSVAACDSRESFLFAYPVFDDVKYRSEGSDKNVIGSFQFGIPVKVLQQSSGQIKVCVDNSPAWASEKDFQLVDQIRELKINSNSFEDRPKINLWTKKQELSNFLNAKKDSKPEYQELIPSYKQTREYSLPVLELFSLESRYRRGNITAARVLVPFPTAARELLMKLESIDTQSRRKLSVVLDVSPSSSWFVSKYFQAKLNDYFSDVELDSIKTSLTLFSGGDYSVVPDVFSLYDVENFNLNTETVGESEENLWLSESLVPSGNNVAGIEYLLVIVSAGDVSIGHDLLVGEPITGWAVQITPELETALRDSVSRLNGIGFIEFNQESHHEFFLSLKHVLLSDLEGLGANLIEEYSSLFEKNSMLTIIPIKLGSFNREFLSELDRRDGRWASIPLWLVVNKDLFEMQAVAETNGD